MFLVSTPRTFNDKNGIMRKNIFSAMIHNAIS